MPVVSQGFRAERVSIISVCGVIGYPKGNEYRKQGDWKHAIDCYLEAIELDAESPAVEAKKMIDDILNFYHKDAYNP